MNTSWTLRHRVEWRSLLLVASVVQTRWAGRARGLTLDGGAAGPVADLLLGEGRVLEQRVRDRLARAGVAAPPDDARLVLLQLPVPRVSPLVPAYGKSFSVRSGRSTVHDAHLFEIEGGLGR